MPEPTGPRRSAPLITSTSNEQVRFVKTLYRAGVRQKEGLFVVEGVRLLEDALASGARPELVLAAPDQLNRTPRGAALLARLAVYRSLTVTDAVLRSLSDTVTPQGVIAVFPIPEASRRLDPGPVALILDRLRDPGNAGTILRSADASGLVRTVAFVDSVDAYAPKVVRAAMGAHFRLTILADAQWSALEPLLGRRPRYLAVESGGEDYARVDWTHDCVLIIGGEAEGAGPEARHLAGHHVTIPMAGPAESLNAAMAATVLLFEAARARRESGKREVTAKPRVAAPPLDEATAPARRTTAPRRNERTPTERSVRPRSPAPAGKPWRPDGRPPRPGKPVPAERDRPPPPGPAHGPGKPPAPGAGRPPTDRTARRRPDGPENAGGGGTKRGGGPGRPRS